MVKGHTHKKTVSRTQALKLNIKSEAGVHPRQMSDVTWGFMGANPEDSAWKTAARDRFGHQMTFHQTPLIAAAMSVKLVKPTVRTNCTRGRIV